MIRLLTLLLIGSFSLSGWAQSNSSRALTQLSFGPVALGENRLPLKATDFEIRIHHHLPQKETHSQPSLQVQAELQDSSLQWVRVEEVILSPRMRLNLKINSTDPLLLALYQGQALMLQSQEESSHLSLFVSLFHPEPIQVFWGDQLITEIQVLAQETQQPPLVDYSCAPFDLVLEGLEGQFVSVGCHLSQSGPVGAEVPLLEVLWLSPHLRLPQGGSPPFVANLANPDPAHLQVQKSDGSLSTVTIQAQVPPRVHRMRTAFGFGPYMMSTQKAGQPQQDRWTSPLMVYGRYTFTPETSARFFNSFSYNGSAFNKLGLYFAYDVGQAFDGRLTVTPLLGLQIITFDRFTEGIYPQGFEVVYRHAFGLKNSILTYGMFLPPLSTNTKYSNTWLRFGRRVFWELNYLAWEKENDRAKIWGLSVGFPLKTFF